MTLLRAVSVPPARILVAAPNRAGELFLCKLRERGLPHAAIVNNAYERSRIEALGISPVITVDTRDKSTWLPPDYPIGKVFLFEDSMSLCCRYIQLCQSWNTGSIHAVTRTDCSSTIYRALGVRHLRYTTKRDIADMVRRTV
ncbi:hypothetical protein ACFFNY_09525 [Paenibacillus hodogayensis]|uniref:RCK N-terminal domain-containing protein n=1 Tax=Paenibacillus hodogayensis TaxID=279208 RepID=A0ABV5VU82_9BACL